METTSPAFRHTLPLQLRFNDIDLLGHVNNSVYFSFYDLGKARYFETVKAQNIDWKKADVVVANVNADFLSPIYPGEPIAVQTCTVEIGNRSFKLLQQIVNTETWANKGRLPHSHGGIRYNGRSCRPYQRRMERGALPDSKGKNFGKK